MDHPKRDPNPDQTRERLLDEAERLFADLGFAAVTVRQITQAAQTNVAAVNYHFGGKENLYLEVFRQRWVPRARRIWARLEPLAARQDRTLEEVVRAIAEAMFMSFKDENERVRHSMLMMREVTKPSAAFEMVSAEATRPALGLVRRLLANCLPGVDDLRLSLYCLSIFFQVLHFNFARSLVAKVTGRLYDDQFLTLLVDHLTDFSVHGMDGARAREREA
jgi:AcrR family transcriptional regulator